MRRLATTIALGLSVAALAVEAQVPLGVDVPIDDPSGTVLPRVSLALDRAARGRGVARFSFWGASHTASDQYTGLLRERLQARYGDGGWGFFSPARPFSLYERRDLVLRSASGVHGVAIRGADRARGAYGRAGVALDLDAGAHGSVRPVSDAPSVAHVEAWAMTQPGGGRLDLEAGATIRGVETDAAVPAPIYLALDVPPGPHGVAFSATNGPVRLFGLLAESGTPGVIVESFGVPGARARDQLLWDSEVFVEHVSRSPPDLVVVAYGTNESAEGESSHPVADVAGELREVIARLRRGAPTAACLVMGPSDRPIERDGVFEPRARTSRLNEAFREAAHTEGCGFFDLLAFQGGPGSMVEWVARGWGLGDHVHMTDEGHERLAEVLDHALTR